MGRGDGPGLLFLVLAGATILAATVSWYAFEKPINNLKRYFPYVFSVIVTESELH